MINQKGINMLKAKNIITIISLFMSLPLLCEARDLVLVKNGEPQAVIVLSKKPTRSAQMGAYELQHNIKLITGAEIPITDSTENDGKVQIFVGESNATKNMGYRSADFKGETSLVNFRNDYIILIGNDSPDYQKVDYKKPNTFPPIKYSLKGSLYAVYDFLENQCGFHFYDLGELGTVYSKRKTLSVKVADKKYTSPLSAFRYVHRDDRRYSKFKYSRREDALWKLRWRMNVMYGLTNHNFYSIYYRYWGIPKWGAERKDVVDLFVKKSPEYFAAGYKGKSYPRDPLMRAGYGNDPDFPPTVCFSNLNVAEYYAKEAVTYSNGGNVIGGFKNFRGKEPTTKTLLPKMPDSPYLYPIEPGDTGGTCECSICTSRFLDQPENERFANLKFQLVANTAKKAAALKPGTGISTLAYINSLYYPKGVKLPENVSVQLCLTIYSWWHPGIKKVQENIYKEWVKKEAKRRPLTLWTYIFSPHWDMKRHFHQKYFFPAVYPWKTGEMFKNFTKDGIKGWFTEVEMQYNSLEAYVAAKICYDPSLDPNQIIDDYFSNYYGDAGKPLKEFYREIETAYWDKNNYPQSWFASNKVVGPRGVKNPTWGTGLHSPDVNWAIGSKKRVAKLNALIKKAQTLVKTPAEKARLQRFIDGIWSQALQGRKKYKSTQDYALVKKTKGKFAIVPPIKDFDGDVQKADWKKAAILGNWKGLDGENVENSSQLKILRDSKFLYLKYSGNASPEISKNIKSNYVEMFFSASPALPLYQLTVFPSGDIKQSKHENIHDILSKDEYDFEAVLVNSLKENSWSFQMAIPLKSLPKINDYSTSYTVNFLRKYESGKSVIWSPILGSHLSCLSSLKYFGKLFFSPEITIQDSRFALIGTSCKRIDDSAASDGKAAIMDGTKGWTVRYLFPDMPTKEYRIYTNIRTDVDNPAGMTTRLGVYSTKKKRTVASKVIKLTDINGPNYQKVYVATVNLTPDMYIYVGGFNKKVTGKKSVYIDRFVLNKAE
jgi:hypothetical protein